MYITHVSYLHDMYMTTTRTKYITFSILKLEIYMTCLKYIKIGTYSNDRCDLIYRRMMTIYTLKCRQ